VTLVVRMNSPSHLFEYDRSPARPTQQPFQRPHIIGGCVDAHRPGGLDREVKAVAGFHPERLPNLEGEGYPALARQYGGGHARASC
jgi:hypothetical protein